MWSSGQIPSLIDTWQARWVIVGQIAGIYATGAAETPLPPLFGASIMHQLPCKIPAIS
jgi:hypothetical protein